MRNKRFVKAVGVACGLALLAAACGDDSSSSPTTTEAKTTTPAGSGSLAGWKGTTPLPESSSEVDAFNARMLEQDSALVDFNYGPESYDAVIVIALAAQIAGTDAIAYADEIVGVTKDGEKCTDWASCKALVDAGTDIDYDGISGPLEFSGNGEPTIGSYGVLTFGEDNRIDDALTTFKGATAPDSVNDLPLDTAEGDRAGNGVLKIGTLLPETGSLAFLGPPEIAGVEIAIAEINAGGGALGKPVETSFSDSGDTTTEIASQSVARLLTEDVDAIVGAASSGVTLSVIDTVVNAGVVMFSPANTSKELSDYADKGLYFRNAPSDILQGGVLAEVLADDSIGTIAIINRDDSYGNGLAEDLSASFTEGGGEVLETVPYPEDATTFEAEVNRLAAADADAIVVLGFEESGRIVAEMIKQGVGPQDVGVYGCDGNMGNATGEKFEEGA